MTELPDGVFRLLLSVLTGGFAAMWLIHDLILLVRLRGDRRDPLIGDKRFGYVVGITIGVIGIVGTLRFNGIL
ncbi:MAG TPA: hypothetical protein VIX73_33305 [Kofleriaceae bacterium]